MAEEGAAEAVEKVANVAGALGPEQVTPRLMKCRNLDLGELVKSHQEASHPGPTSQEVPAFSLVRHWHSRFHVAQS